MATMFMAVGTLIVVYALARYTEMVRQQRLLRARRRASALKATATRRRNKALRMAQQLTSSDEAWLIEGIANALQGPPAVDTAIGEVIARPAAAKAVTSTSVHWPFYADSMDRVGTLGPNNWPIDPEDPDAE